jgi:hypothetical protein
MPNKILYNIVDINFLNRCLIRFYTTLWISTFWLILIRHLTIFWVLPQIKHRESAEMTNWWIVWPCWWCVIQVSDVSASDGRIWRGGGRATKQMPGWTIRGFFWDLLKTDYCESFCEGCFDWSRMNGDTKGFNHPLRSLTTKHCIHMDC